MKGRVFAEIAIEFGWKRIQIILGPTPADRGPYDEFLVNYPYFKDILALSSIQSITKVPRHMRQAIQSNVTLDRGESLRPSAGSQIGLLRKGVRGAKLWGAKPH